VVVSVDDDGVGMEPEVIGRVFNAFEQGGKDTTRQFGGLGLGLAICKAVVEMHGGTVWARSPGRGKGSTFTVQLPLAASTAVRPAAPAASHGAARRSGVRVLLVEDHEDSARILARLLRRDGHQVKTASEVAMALRMSQAEEFDLVISDIGLPDGTGLDLMRQLRLERPGIRGIALSGHGQESDLQMSRIAGFSAHLVKPLDPSKLEDVVADVLARPPVSTPPLSPGDAMSAYGSA
jgi:CheY-like chemotaxis protein